MVVSLELASILFLSLLHIPWILCTSSALCPHTIFYHDCWIRRFPGLLLSFSASEQRGARVLQRQAEPSAHLCSRRCCDQESCNVAVFYSGSSTGTDNCHLMHCPQPESCLVRGQERSTLFTVTAGVDPDLLVFDTLGRVDLNPRSSVRWERPNISQAIASTPPPVLATKERPVNQSSSSSPKVPPPPPPQQSPPQLLSPADSPLRSSVTPEAAFISPALDRSLQDGGLTQEPIPSSPPLDRPMSEGQSPAHLDSSKQHVNETKGHSGRNQTAEGEAEDRPGPWDTLWPLPALIGSTVTLLCCCSGILALGCCRRRRRGRYRPGREGNAGQGPLIRCTLLREKD